MEDSLTIRMPELPDPMMGCIYKLYYGETYVVVKAKTYQRSKTIIEYALDRYLKAGKKDLLYNRFFAYIQAYRKTYNHQLLVKVILKSNSPYQLLKKEQEELDKARYDLNCFNNSFDAYVPKGIQGRRKQWINRGHYLNFMMWKKRRKSQLNQSI
jgi:hypothetical protein